MADVQTRSAGKSTGKQGRVALKELTQSPGRYLFLSPNDDSFERRQARLARAAATQKRRSLAFGDPLEEQTGRAHAGEQAPGILSKSQVLELLTNCIKLAAENKINQQNTWDLKLIDYLTDIVKVDNDDEDTQTNFQKVSCTLEASAKIYSCRVDSVHTETYKVLGGLHRSAASRKDKNAGQGSEEDCENDVEHDETQDARRKDSHRKTSDHTNTLETYENISVKDLEMSLNVDPLFHQISAQFDDGGAKGLLLNNLSVYRGCEILFDSQDVPDQCMRADLPKDPPVIDLSFASDIIKQICSDRDNKISPSLSEILKLLDDPFRKAAEAEQSTLTTDDAGSWFDDNNAGEAGSCFGNNDGGDAGSWLGNNEGGDMDMGEVFDAADYAQEEGYASPKSSSGASHSPLQQDDEADLVEDFAYDDTYTVDWLREGMEIPNKSNSWAGADFWKFRRPKETLNGIEREQTTTRETKFKRKEPFSLVYTPLPEIDLAVFAKPRDLRRNLLPQSKHSTTTTLPEDLRYQVDDLLRLFLRPSIMCVRGRRVNTTGQGKSTQASPFRAWNDDNDDSSPHNDYWAGDDCHSEIEDNLDELIAQPRKVQKIEVNYDKTSKQVDVHALKESIWEHIQDMESGNEDEGVQFSDLLGKVPSNCAAAAPEDLSVHLCFICLLHLANEHNLVIKDAASLNELLILKFDQGE